MSSYLVNSILLVTIALTLGCSVGDAIDKLCIKGRISAEQAKLLSQTKWQHTPTYCTSRNGRSDCEPNEYDRVLSANCSEALKSL